MINNRTVFVIYGRNIAIKNAMFTFLRSLNLQPLEWEQARQLTGKASPTVLEVVETGIENSQAVVVLFTADDIAQTRKIYGNEKQGYQPSPDVLFKAGWAYGIAGQERTILVGVSKVRDLSKIIGLDIIFLDDNPESRKTLAEKLRTAGCSLDDSGTDFLSPLGGGDFSQNGNANSLLLEVQEAYRELLDRGKFTEFLADSSLFFGANSIKINQEFFSALRTSSFIDLKYHYLGPFCAGNWINLCKHPEYNHNFLLSILEESCDSIAPYIVERLNSEQIPLDVVSLGSGDGNIDARFLFKLTKLNLKIGYYYCIDISFDLLQHAAARICQDPWINKDIRVKAIYGDFTELPKLSPIYTFDESVNLFLLIGNTLGNYNEGQLLNSFLGGMQPGDFLLLDARLHDISNWDDTRLLNSKEKEKIIALHDYNLNRKFAFGPIEVATSYRVEDIKIEYEISRKITVVPKGINIILYCENFDAEVIGLNKRIQSNRLDLGATTMYSYEALKNWFPTRDFNVVWSNKIDSLGLFLLQKRH